MRQFPLEGGRRAAACSLRTACGCGRLCVADGVCVAEGVPLRTAFALQPWCSALSSEELCARVISPATFALTLRSGMSSTLPLARDLLVLVLRDLQSRSRQGIWLFVDLIQPLR